VVPAAVLVGGAFLAWMDALARVVVSPAELPVGILTALAGAPVLVALLGLGPKRQHKRAATASFAPPRPASVAVAAPDSAAAPEPEPIPTLRPALACRTLTLQHPNTPQPAVAALDLAWPLGRLVAVVGPNGAGKTTLLRAFAGLMPVNRGAILDDDCVRHGRPDARRIAFLPQQATAEPGILTDDLVALGRTAHLRGNFALRLWGRLDARDRKAVDGALHRMELTELRRAPIETLSGGQRQRAFLSMVLAQEAPVLLLDEPTASLDLPQADRLLRRLGDLAHKDGALVVLAIHDLRLALAHADEVWVLAEGHLVGHGGPQDESVGAALAQAFGPEVRGLLARR
jgi:iron complex transport system ATP-binding protein